MDAETREMFQAILSGMEGLEERFNAKMEETKTHMNVLIENYVGKRIDTLFDGYKLAHEKQWELQHETEKLKEQISDLQTRLAILEKKISA